MSLWCEPRYTLVYNDAYRRVLGTRPTVDRLNLAAMLGAE